MKKIFATLLALLMLLSLVSCGGSGKEPSSSSGSSASRTSSSSQESTPTPEPTEEPTAEPEPSEEESTESSLENQNIPSGNLPEGLHIVGSDIDEGTYLLTCTEVSAWVLEIVVFESSDKYEDYFNSDRVTGGEERAAVEQNAIQSFDLSEGEAYFLSLEKGNIIMTDMGVGNLEKIDISEKIYPGIYFAGRDLENGKYIISAEDSSIEVDVFETKESYISYFSSDRGTGGDEDTAVANNASVNEYLYSGDSYIVDLTGNQVLMIKYNSGNLALVSSDS